MIYKVRCKVYFDFTFFLGLVRQYSNKRNIGSQRSRDCEMNNKYFAWLVHMLNRFEAFNFVNRNIKRPIKRINVRNNNNNKYIMLIYFARHGILKVIFQVDDSCTMRSH